MAGATRYLAGGVSSNFRLGISPTPLVIERGEGPYLFDVDGNQLIDYYLGMGPMILGHNPAVVLDAVRRQLDKGILFAGQTEIEFEAAPLVCQHGALRRAGALRLVRVRGGAGGDPPGAGRDRPRSTIVKFEGPLSRLARQHPVERRAAARPRSRTRRRAPAGRRQRRPGRRSPALHTEVIGWNDLDAVVARLERGDVAGVIMEPAMCNSSVIPPRPGYLEGVRDACTRTGTVLIFDEVITGFRLGIGGAQGQFRRDARPRSVRQGARERLPGRRARRPRRHHGLTHNGRRACMAAPTTPIRRAWRRPSRRSPSSPTGDAYAAIEKRGRRLMDGIAGLLRDYQVVAHVQGFPRHLPRRHRHAPTPIDQLSRQPADGPQAGLCALHDRDARARRTRA